MTKERQRQDLEGLGQEPLNLPRPRHLDLVLHVKIERCHLDNH